jgi:hypothetical protein
MDDASDDNGGRGNGDNEAEGTSTGWIKWFC